MIKKLKVTVDSKTYDVTVEMPEPVAQPTKKVEPLPQSVPAAGPVAPTVSVRAASPGDVISPLSGRVISIGVQSGQRVNEGDHVLTLEAMKMNTFVFAPKSGTIKEIKTDVGSGVQEGDVLLTME